MSTKRKRKRAVGSIIDNLIHPATGLKYGTVYKFINGDFRWAVIRRARHGRKIIHCIARGDTDTDLHQMDRLKKDMIEQLHVADIPEHQINISIGLVQVTACTAATIADHEKYQAWLNSADPKF